MRPTDSWESGHGIDLACPLMHTIRSMPDAFRGRCRQLEEIQRWLGAYFQVVGIMLQIPGGAEYEWLPEDADDAEELVWRADRDMLYSILASALRHLDAEAVMDQVPGSDEYRPRRVPVEFRLALAERDDNGVLNLIALCLDRLMVLQDLPQEERCLHDLPAPRPRLWRRCARGVIAILRRFRASDKPRCVRPSTLRVRAG